MTPGHAKHSALRRVAIAAVVLACVSLPLACTPAQYAKLADRSAYGTLHSGQKAALGGPKAFSIAYNPYLPTVRGPKKAPVPSIRVGEKVIPLGETAPRMPATASMPATSSYMDQSLTKVTLDECLDISFRNSRDYQDRKEKLYSDALALASARREWDWNFFGGSLTGDASHTKIGDTPTDTNSGAAELGLTFSQKFFSGAELALGATMSLASDLLGTKSTTIGSLLEANFTQPLLRGAWRGFAYEEVYRETRDFVFSVYSFERYTQTFAVGIITDYYRVLARRDELENERENIDRLKQTFALTKLMVEGGQVSRIQQDQAESDLLSAQVRFEQSQQAYQNELDQFKLTLGLPIQARMDVDYPAALNDLNRIGLTSVPIAEPKAVALAMSTRPDVLTQRAAVRDARVDTEIAADNFLPQLDVTLGISAPGTAPRDFSRIQFNHHTRTAAVSFDYTLDQTDNRDAYRLSLIANQKALRDYALFEDQVRLDVRQSYRSLLQNRRSYQLQLRNVAIAKRRRKLAALQQREGQASARDVLEAEEALRNAQNGLTTALVSYTTTRLSFLAGLGLLQVEEASGEYRLNERKEPFGFERLDGRFPEVHGK